MLEKYFKTISEKFAIPFIKICIFLKIKPNVLSVIGLFTIILGSYSFLTSNSLIGLLLIFLGSAIDGLDGPLARTLNADSKKGALLDSTIDRIGELFIWAVVSIKFVSNDIELFTTISIVTASGLIPYLRAKGESLNINNKGGITQRPERVIFAVLYMYYQFSFIYVYIFSMLTWLTVLQRFLKIYKSKL